MGKEKREREAMKSADERDARTPAECMHYREGTSKGRAHCAAALVHRHGPGL